MVLCENNVSDNLKTPVYVSEKTCVGLIILIGFSTKTSMNYCGNYLKSTIGFTPNPTIQAFVDPKNPTKFCGKPFQSKSAYISSHLNAVGYPSQAFSDSALDLIAKASSGSLRLTNKICTHYLTFAEQRGTKEVDDAMVSAIVDIENS